MRTREPRRRRRYGPLQKFLLGVTRARVQRRIVVAFTPVFVPRWKLIVEMICNRLSIECVYHSLEDPAFRGKTYVFADNRKAEDAITRSLLAACPTGVLPMIDYGDVRLDGRHLVEIAVQDARPSLDRAAASLVNQGLMLRNRGGFAISEDGLDLANTLDVGCVELGHIDATRKVGQAFGLG